MPSIPLYTSNPQLPDASHDVRAPGGYEWWYFDAEDPASDTQIVAIFLHGFAFHPGYLRAVGAYLKRPTRLAPPSPTDYPCTYLCVYRRGQIARQFMTQYRPADYHANRDTADLSIGPNTLTKDGESLRLSLSGTPWRLTWRGPKTLVGESLTADLTFTPTFSHAPAERVFLSRALAGADHRWVIANPHCDVSGTFTLSRDGEAEEHVRFAGRGYHDHNFGTGPLGPGLRRWIWGRAMLDDRVMTFHYALPIDRSLPEEIHLVEADANGFREIAIRHVTADWSGRMAVNVRYPRQLAFDDALALSKPRVIDSTPFYMRLIYNASLRGRQTQAFCEVASPNRLRWLILGRMIEMSIDKRACR